MANSYILGSFSLYSYDNLVTEFHRIPCSTSPKKIVRTK
jgi:hypothetical protein